MSIACMTAKSRLASILGMVLLCGMSACGPAQTQQSPNSESTGAAESSVVDGKKLTRAAATFGGGCFWCVEGVFENMKGVHDVVSGYAGGDLDNPTYKQVCTGRTGHAEVCQIHYDPSQVSFEELLEVFFKTHDPTTLNKQGFDVGTQYRSCIFYHSDDQRVVAEAYIKQLDESGVFPDAIVTQIEKLPKFYEAEQDHQDYFRRNPDASYCMAVVRPKVDKFKKIFADKVITPK